MKDKVAQVIFAAIDDVNRLLPKGKQLGKSNDTVLFGQSGVLDSLGFVNLVVAAEQKVEEGFGTTVSLADQGATAQNNGSFETVGSLIDYISSLLKEKASE